MRKDEDRMPLVTFKIRDGILNHYVCKYLMVILSLRKCNTVWLVANTVSIPHSYSITNLVSKEAVRLSSVNTS